VCISTTVSGFTRMFAGVCAAPRALSCKRTLDHECCRPVHDSGRGGRAHAPFSLWHERSFFCVGLSGVVARRELPFHATVRAGRSTSHFVGFAVHVCAVSRSVAAHANDRSFVGSTKRALSCIDCVLPFHATVRAGRTHCTWCSSGRLRCVVCVRPVRTRSLDTHTLTTTPSSVLLSACIYIVTPHNTFAVHCQMHSRQIEVVSPVLIIARLRRLLLLAFSVRHVH